MVFKGFFTILSMDFKWAIEQLYTGKKVMKTGCAWFLECKNGFVKPYSIPEKRSLESSGINICSMMGESWELFESTLSEKLEEIELNKGDGFFKVVRVDYIKDAFVEIKKAAIDVCPDGGEVLCVPLSIIKDIFGKELI
jgi:hypothetical protein